MEVENKEIHIFTVDLNFSVRIWHSFEAELADMISSFKWQKKY